MKFNATNVAGGTKTLADGNQIPLLGLGTAEHTDQKDVSTMVEAALKAGYRLFDTAQIYKNERELGVAFAENLSKFGLKREDIFITTKVQIMDGKVSEWAEHSLKQSLDKLKTDYIDMFLIHAPRDRIVGKDEAYELNKKGRKELWQKLEEFKDRGVVKSIGVSNYEVYHLVELFEYAKQRPVMNQIEYSPYLTRPTLKHFCEMNKIFVQAFSSQCRDNNEIYSEGPVQKLAKKYDVAPQTILYAFGRNSGVGIIPRSGNPAHIGDNLHENCKLANKLRVVCSMFPSLCGFAPVFSFCREMLIPPLLFALLPMCMFGRSMASKFEKLKTVQCFEKCQRDPSYDKCMRLCLYPGLDLNLYYITCISFGKEIRC
ncbi:unnamed protein product [Cylicocyclus nassatus]|uniref:NADP-dependent oxidoreductase domain-containing protein n=1 Tax=Cylicocyclus nassatus TaxID=53992 RepID=A0AA36GWT4_CYLNA|nr:unnamed protein product [Cylicocyclus nassatus]